MKTAKDIIGVGMPAWLHLDRFGRIVKDVFGDYPYLVGSAARGKKWRDVDIRLILDDAAWDTMFGKWEGSGHVNAKWSGLCCAFAELGKAMTGLPVDFQIDRMTQANEKHSGPRHALGIHASATILVRYEKADSDEVE